jgi:glucosyl-3-phosphoglycerate synthase
LEFQSGVTVSDFYQTGIITTLHNLGKASLDRLESELREQSRTRPVALVLPALYSEFEGRAMPRIVEELAKVRYIEQIVLVLRRASDKDFIKAKEFMAPISYEVKIIHNEGVRVREITTPSEERPDPARREGMVLLAAYGYALAAGRPTSLRP